jgi:hypothetical protein
VVSTVSSSASSSPLRALRLRFFPVPRRLGVAVCSLPRACELTTVAQRVGAQLKQLQAEPKWQWLQLLLVSFNAGDLEGYERLCGSCAAELSAQPALVASAVKLREKITILCLMEIIFAYAPPLRERERERERDRERQS